MKLFRFLTGDDESTFCHKVTAALNKGWELYGAPQYSFDDNLKKMRCGQAVIKTVEGKTYDPSIKLSEH